MRSLYFRINETESRYKMAGVIFLRVTVCPRTALLFSKRTVRTFNLHKYYNLKCLLVRSLCLLRAASENNLSTLLKRNMYPRSSLYTHNGCPLQSYSCCKGFPHTHSTKSYSSDDKSHKKVDIKEVNTEKQTGSTGLGTVLKATDEDVCTERHNEAMRSAKEQLEQLKAVDTSTFDDKNDGTDENLKYTGFEYDYQVAEDVEEYDYIDERKLAEQQLRPAKVLPISLERGKDGVFELHELVTLLENLGAENIVTFPVPPEANFCDHMVVASAKSRRHLQAINDEMLWVHKRKKSQKDHHLVIEGIDKSNWCAMDMGNIVLHVFHGNSREFYNIESLWTLGPDRDPLCQQQSIDPYVLSAEDLFWLETGNIAGKGKATTPQDDRNMAGSDGTFSGAEKGKSWPDDVTESDAGWGPSKSAPIK